MQEELWGDLRVAYLPEVCHGLIVISSIKFGVAGGDSSNRLRLPRRIFSAGSNDKLAYPASAIEVQAKRAQPRLAEVEKPRIVPVLLGHFSLSPDNPQYLSKPAKVE